MEKDLVKEAICLQDEKGNDFFIDEDEREIKDCKQCLMIKNPPIDFHLSEEAKVVKTEGRKRFVVRSVVATMGSWAGYLSSEREQYLQDSIDEVDDRIDRDDKPKNITLWKNESRYRTLSCDVIYRTRYGTVVAKNLDSGDKLYTIKLPRVSGNQEEMLLQSADGDVVVVGKDGTAHTWSHKVAKLRGLVARL